MNRQPDLFATTASVHQPVALDRASMEKRVRPGLEAIMHAARTADSLPWDERQTRINCYLIHQSSNWLPVEERDAMRAEFIRELERLGAPEPNLAVNEAVASATRRAAKL